MDANQQHALFERFGIGADNPGVCLGPGQWRGAGAKVVSVNPANEQALAGVTLASADDLEAVIAAATSAAHAWREVPAPQRGEAVRRFGNLLREHKDALGTLVSLENGKIKAEGDGEVQEMIDIADFAVGLSRHALRQDDAFRARRAPDVRAMASAGRRRRDLRVQLPGGRVGLERAARGGVRQCDRVEALAARRRSRRSPCSTGQSRDRARAVAPPIFTLVIDAGSDSRRARWSRDPRMPLVSFTGSSAVGRHIAETVARRFGTHAARMRRQQRDHRGRGCGPRPRRARRPVRRGRHGGSALHDHAPR